MNADYQTEMDEEFWDAMRDQGHLITDMPSFRIAVFATDDGTVCLASLEDGRSGLFALGSSAAKSLAARLVEVASIAAKQEDEIEAQYQTFYAIEKASGR